MREHQGRLVGSRHHGFYRLSPYFEGVSAIFEKIRALFYTQTSTGTAPGEHDVDIENICTLNHISTLIRYRLS